MYKKNKRSQQPLLISDVNDLPKRSLQYLKHSWAETFRREVFLRIPEDRFAVLYDPDPSRPNVPVNILVGLNVLKEWHNWSDEEMYEHFLFDLQVRYALGCDTFGDGDFDLRTMYYFRKRLSEHALKTGENLIQVAFEHITDEQIQKLNVNTKIQRMDSTQILSNIADLSRLELLVGVLQRLHRILRKDDQAQYQEVFQPFIKESAGQYTYRIKGKAAVWEHIQQVGQVLHHLLQALAKGYQEQSTYQVAQRFFDENFKRVQDRVEAKSNSEIEPGCLQSLDDLEAGFRRKGNHSYKGFVGNVTETCDPNNPLQLITQVDVQSNRVSDIELLQQALPELKGRMEVDTLVTDGAYTGPSVDQTLQLHSVQQITTGLIGALPLHPDGRLAMSDFAMELDAQGDLMKLTCPTGYEASLGLQPSGKSYRVTFREADCQACSLFQAGQCPTRKYQRWEGVGFNLPKRRILSSLRIRRFLACKEEARALRPAAEATVFQVKHQLDGGKVRVRGVFRTCCVIVCAAIGVNLRRIYRYENDQQRGKWTSKKARKDSFWPFFHWAQLINGWFSPAISSQKSCFGC
jgi:hypothetical protein